MLSVGSASAPSPGRLVGTLPAAMRSAQGTKSLPVASATEPLAIRVARRPHPTVRVDDDRGRPAGRPSAQAPAAARLAHGGASDPA